MREFVVKDWKSTGPLRLLRSPQDASPVTDRREDPSREDAAVPPPETSAEAGEPPAAVEADGVAGTAPEARGHEDRSDPAPALDPPASDHREVRDPEVTDPKRRGERLFIVSYEGSYIGFFEAEEELKPQEAYMYVARDLAARGPFDPEKLSLHKPVLIKSARPPRGSTFVRGKLSRVQRGPGESLPEGLPSEEPLPEPREELVLCLDDAPPPESEG